MNKTEKIALEILSGIAVTTIGWGISKLFDDNPSYEANKNYNVNNETLPMETKELHYFMKKAQENYEGGNYRYALFDARLVLQNALKLYLDKNNCEIKDDRTVKYLVACEDNNLLDEEFANKLHKARKMCNVNSHDLVCNDATQENTNYAIGQINNLLKFIDEFLKTNKEVLANA